MSDGWLTDQEADDFYKELYGLCITREELDLSETSEQDESEIPLQLPKKALLWINYIESVEDRIIELDILPQQYRYWETHWDKLAKNAVLGFYLKHVMETNSLSSFEPIDSKTVTIAYRWRVSTLASNLYEAVVPPQQMFGRKSTNTIFINIYWEELLQLIKESEKYKTAEMGYWVEIRKSIESVTLRRIRYTTPKDYPGKRQQKTCTTDLAEQHTHHKVQVSSSSHDDEDIGKPSCSAESTLQNINPTISSLNIDEDDKPKEFETDSSSSTSSVEKENMSGSSFGSSSSSPETMEATVPQESSSDSDDLWGKRVEDDSSDEIIFEKNSSADSSCSTTSSEQILDDDGFPDDDHIFVDDDRNKWTYEVMQNGVRCFRINLDIDDNPVHWLDMCNRPHTPSESNTTCKWLSEIKIEKEMEELKKKCEEREAIRQSKIKLKKKKNECVTESGK